MRHRQVFHNGTNDTVCWPLTHRLLKRARVVRISALGRARFRVDLRQAALGPTVYNSLDRRPNEARCPYRVVPQRQRPPTVPP